MNTDKAREVDNTIWNIVALMNESIHGEEIILSRSDQKKLEEILKSFSDQEVKATIIARGGEMSWTKYSSHQKLQADNAALKDEVERLKELLEEARSVYVPSSAADIRWNKELEATTPKQ